ncbi:hypothetical protein B0T26DRAFT_681696 [Lasiosphaeria miniovina]|nr:uncharacterized protein B0T26DRAFT_681696 [Lasiosphaeria miniovina]KAK0704088.1 hypothetical protein B0T26DRAFT_681696 [Lasiosphaeria miniovina]
MTKVPIHKIPHILFATTGTRSHPIFAFFPAMYEPECSIFLSDKMYATFYDHLLHPALEQLSYRAQSARFSSDAVSQTSQHIPPNFIAAQNASRAKLEKSGKGGGAHGSPIGITINPSKDTMVWNHMVQELDNVHASRESTLLQFTGMFFLYNAKGLKLETQRQRVLSECIEDFAFEQAEHFKEVLSVENQNRQYIDVAAEVMSVPDGNYPQGATLLAKRCYGQLRESRRASSRRSESGSDSDAGEDDQAITVARGPRDAAFQPPHIPRATVTEYPIGLLRDTVTLTAEPKRNHPHTNDGLIYLQSYSPLKERMDAKKIYPFSHPGIANLGYSEADHNSINILQRTNNNRSEAKSADIRSRKRIKEVLKHTRTENFGWRTEFRVTLGLAHVIWEEDECWAKFLGEFSQETRIQNSGLSTRVISSGQAQADVNNITFPSDAFHIYRTNEFRNFLQGNIQKHLIVVDTIRALYSPNQATPLEVARLHGLLILGLRHFISHLSPSEAWMLNNPLRRSNLETRKPGFGLRETMDRFGFGFFHHGIVDWRDFKISKEYIDSVTLPGFQVVTRYLPVVEYQETRSFLDELLEIIDKQTPREISEFVLEKCVHLILQNYRQVAFLKLLGQKEKQPPTPVSGRSFCLQGLQQEARKIGRDVGMIKGNKSYFKKMHTFFVWTWEKTEIGTLNEKGSSFATVERLTQILAYRFFEQHTALPYPDSNGSMQQVRRDSVTARNGRSTL